jgi:hypothetical protein
LTPDSIQQKYAQTVVSMRIVPGCVRFLGEEKRFYTVWVNRYTGDTAASPAMSAMPPKAEVKFRALAASLEAGAD